MKTIGLLGGMSWESSANYYKIINQEVKKILGGLHSARVILNSVDFQQIEHLQHLGKWDELARILSNEAKNIENAKADVLIICTNTMHKVAPQIEKNINIPILHIADATAQVLVNDGIKNVALLGTAFTMEQGFYKDRLRDKYNLNVLVPQADDIQIIHNIIYQELCLGVITEESKKQYLNIMDKLVKNKAEAVILGCTEIGMLINEKDTDIKLYDTTTIHAKKAVEYAIKS